jgi:hypothetical protein
MRTRIFAGSSHLPPGYIFRPSRSTVSFSSASHLLHLPIPKRRHCSGMACVSFFKTVTQFPYELCKLSSCPETIYHFFLKNSRTIATWFALSSPKNTCTLPHEEDERFCRYRMYPRLSASQCQERIKAFEDSGCCVSSPSHIF